MIYNGIEGILTIQRSAFKLLTSAFQGSDYLITEVSDFKIFTSMNCN